MADEVKAAPAPAAAPANPNVAPATQAPAAGNIAASGAAPTPKYPGRSSLITNPTPVVDPDAPVVEAKVEHKDLPQATIDEMAAGKKALERNRPTAERMEAARQRLDDDNTIRRGATTAPSNPVDATNKLQSEGKV